LAEQDVPARLEAMRTQSPEIVDAAAHGLDVANVKHATSDSVYLSLRPTFSSKQTMIDVGLAHSGTGWKVFYLTIPERM
jgi:hypothetical protein